MKKNTATLTPANRFCDEKGRLYYFDNAKFLLIVLVVIAHALSPLKTDNGAVHVIWKLINCMHMPTFIFISGFFAKGYLQKSGRLKAQRTFTYISLFLFSQLFVSLFEYFVLDHKVGFSLLSARSSLWFLQCLLVWYLVLPFFAQFKGPVVLVAAVITGLVIGYDPTALNVLAISRVIVHFPFFMAGYFCTPEVFNKLRTLPFRIIGLVFLGLSIFLFAYFGKYIGDGLFTCNVPYASLVWAKDLPLLLRWLPRFLFYVFALGLGAGFLAWVPRAKTFFTRFGPRTLQVYILHRFLYLAWLDYEWWTLDWLKNLLLGLFADKTVPAWITADWLTNGTAPWLVAVLALILTFVLSLRVFQYPFDLIQKINITKALKKK